MSSSPPQPGSITWQELNVADADRVRDFYEAIAGWKTERVDMGGYSDYSMVAPATGQVVAGICHARGPNAELPPQWLVYITVADVAESARRCAELGGKIVAGPKPLGGGMFCVIQDPAGAVCALFKPGSP